MKYLILAPGGWGDVATDTLAAYNEQFANWLNKRGICYILLRNEAVVRHVIENHLLNDSAINTLSWGGHGDPRTFTGYEGDVIVKVGDDVTLYQGKGGHFLSCSMGKELAPYLQEQGMPVVIAYDDLFRFYRDTSKPPLEDEKAASFMLAHLILDRRWAEGYVAEAAKEDSDLYFENEARKWEPTHPHIAATLRADARHSVAFGNKSWKPGNREPPPNKKIVHVELMPSSTGMDVEFEVIHAITKEPVEGALVLLHDVDWVEHTGPDGTALFEDVPAGQHPWSVGKEGFDPAEGIVTVP